jgi:sugar/nucleoside kinase (ribokinase family)
MKFRANVYDLGVFLVAREAGESRADAVKYASKDARRVAAWARHQASAGGVAKCPPRMVVVKASGVGR